MKHSTVALTAIIAAAIFSAAPVMANDDEQYDGEYFIGDIHFNKGESVSVSPHSGTADISAMEVREVRYNPTDTALEIVDHHINTE